MILTELNVELYAAKGYENPNCASMEEFIEDYNTFDNTICTRLLFYKLKKYLEYIVPFLLLLNRLPKTVLDENNIVIYTSDIKMNSYVVDKLREI